MWHANQEGYLVIEHDLDNGKPEMKMLISNMPYALHI